MGFGSTETPLNFDSHLDDHLDTRKSGFSHFLIFTCPGRGMCSPSGFVDIEPSIKSTDLQLDLNIDSWYITFNTFLVFIRILVISKLSTFE